MTAVPVLEGFFRARHVVVVGASARPGTLGGVLASNLVRAGFPGTVAFVNPSGGELMDRPIHPALDDVSGHPDLAVLLVPAAAVPATLDACGRRGIRMAIVASGGFRETGDAGRRLETELAAVVRRHGIRLVGPNCIGLIAPELGLDTSFLAGPPVPGGAVGLVSHSGALCASAVEWARDDGFGFSRLISLGNQVDVDESDALDALAADPSTRVAALYLEGVRNGRRFVAALARAARSKPVVVLKGGRTEGGRRAAASHTGALAGSDRAFDAAVRRAGAVRVTTTEQLFDAARTLASCPAPRGRRVAILTNAGGPGVAAADAVVREGLVVAELEGATRTSLTAVLPEAGSAANPVDLLASASPGLYGDALSVLLAADEVDAALVLLPPPPAHRAEDVAARLAMASAGSDKPVLTALMGAAGVAGARRVLAEAGMVSFRYPESAAWSLACLTRQVALPQAPEVVRPEAPVLTGEAGFLPSASAFEALAAAGVAVARHRIATTGDEAADAARAIGFPVAIKVEVDGPLHKKAAGGLKLGLQSAADVRAAFESWRDAFADRGFRGVLVQEMVAPGDEVIVGVAHDPSFGRLVMVGSGGSTVEREADVVFGLAPIPAGEAADMLRLTRVGRTLDGQGAIAAVTEAVVRIAALAAANPRLLELDVNPLRVVDGVAVALDVRLRLADPA